MKSSSSPREGLPRQARLCLAVIALLAAACWLALLLPGHDPHQPDWNALSSPPSLASGHWFGTDAIGRDILARTLAGGRLSLTVGALARKARVYIGQPQQICDKPQHLIFAAIARAVNQGDRP